jgi:hypothetical protein
VPSVRSSLESRRIAALPQALRHFRTIALRHDGAVNLDEHSNPILIGRIEGDFDVLRASSGVVE